METINLKDKKMNNSDMPAMPVDVAPLSDAFNSNNSWAKASLGLTKRDHFAGLAMQGLCSDPNMNTLGVVELAVVISDALLKALETSHE
jgi:hypothetical protein